jgi:hypothetical protein
VNPFRIRASWLRDVARLRPTIEGIPLSLPFVEFQGTVDGEERQILLLLLAGAERIRFNPRPCCEACVDMAATSFRRIESLGQLALRALAPETESRAARILVRALVNSCRDYHTYIRTSPVPILPIPYQVGWNEELRELCLETVKTLSIHLTAVIGELETLSTDVELPTRHYRRLPEWPEEAYISDDRR